MKVEISLHLMILLFLVTLSPLSPHSVASAADATAYGWEKSNLDMTLNTFAISSHNPNVLFAGSELAFQNYDGNTGLFRSDDGGKIWYHLWGDDVTRVRSIAISRQDSMKMFIGVVSGRTEYGLFATSDGGNSWHKVAVDLATLVQSVVVHPLNDQLVLAGTQWGVIQSEDGGITWRLSSEGLQAVSGDYPWVQKIAPSPSNPNIIFALTDRDMQFQSLLGHPAKTSVVDDVTNQTSFQFKSRDVVPGVFISANGGNSWQRIGLDLNQFTSFYDVAIHPENPEIFYIGSRGGLYKTVDGGSTFERLADGLSSVWTVTIDPVDTRILYIGTGITGGCFRSLDGGQSWAQVFNRFDRSVYEAGVSEIRVHPNNHNQVYLGGRLVGNFYRKTFQDNLEKEDFNEDGVIDFDDFLLFAEHFQLSVVPIQIESRFDLNGNGKVDFDDFLRFVDVFRRM